MLRLLVFNCAGGRAVIDGMQKHLALSDAAIEASRAGLYRWGNVSSASVWCVVRLQLVNFHIDQALGFSVA